MPFVSSVKESIRRRGLTGFVLRVLYLGFNFVTNPVGNRIRAWRKRRIRPAIDDQFDRAHGVDTSGSIPALQLEADHDRRVHATAYQAVYPKPFAKVMAQLAIDFERTTFVDVGSGKGRALLIACEYPFKQIVGVEFSPDLHHIAEKNCQRYQSTTQRCRQFDLKCMDATEYRFPAGPVLMFMYNPFDEVVMEPLAENVGTFLRSSTAPFTLVYFNPRIRAPWDNLADVLEYVEVKQPVWPGFNGLVVGVWRSKPTRRA